MITQEHLEHWLGEIHWQLNGILQEIRIDKVQMSGINVGKNGEQFVSFTYLLEKAEKIEKFLAHIESEIINDEMSSLR